MSSADFRGVQADEIGLKKLKEKYTQELMELNKSKPKDKGDEGLLENLARLNAQLGVSRDSLVSFHLSDQAHITERATIPPLGS